MLICLFHLNQQVNALNREQCKCRTKVSNRIIGGGIAKMNAYPWQISLGILPVSKSRFISKNMIHNEKIKFVLGYTMGNQTRKIQSWSTRQTTRIL